MTEQCTMSSVSGCTNSGVFLIGVDNEDWFFCKSHFPIVERCGKCGHLNHIAVKDTTVDGETVYYNPCNHLAAEIRDVVKRDVEQLKG